MTDSTILAGRLDVGHKRAPDLASIRRSDQAVGVVGVWLLVVTRSAGVERGFACWEGSLV
jgi:hypothetical protein